MASRSIVGYGIDCRRPGNGYLILLDYRNRRRPLIVNQNYWLFRLNLRTLHRAACPGCQDQGYILSNAFCSRATMARRSFLDNPDKFGRLVKVNAMPVSTNSTTWTQLKSMYR